MTLVFERSKIKEPFKMIDCLALCDIYEMLWGMIMAAIYFPQKLLLAFIKEVIQSR